MKALILLLMLCGLAKGAVQDTIIWPATSVLTIIVKHWDEYQNTDGVLDSCEHCFVTADSSWQDTAKVMQVFCGDNMDGSYSCDTVYRKSNKIYYFYDKTFDGFMEFIRSKKD